jgi:hypothetical protein
MEFCLVIGKTSDYFSKAINMIFVTKVLCGFVKVGTKYVHLT